MLLEWDRIISACFCRLCWASEPIRDRRLAADALKEPRKKQLTNHGLAAALYALARGLIARQTGGRRATCAAMKCGESSRDDGQMKHLTAQARLPLFGRRRRAAHALYTLDRFHLDCRASPGNAPPLVIISRACRALFVARASSEKYAAQKKRCIRYQWYLLIVDKWLFEVQANIRFNISFNISIINDRVHCLKKCDSLKIAAINSYLF